MKPNKPYFFSLLVLLMLLAGIINTSAQTPKPSATPNCASIRVSCPDAVPAGQPLTFTADVSGGDSNVTPTFNWSVSAGTISSGQGTSSITVDTTALAGQYVTATVEIGGYPRECSTFDSCTASVTKKSESRKFDEYGKINAEDEKARLDNFEIALKNDPSATGYIITYGGRRSAPDEARKMADSSGDYLLNIRGLKSGRVLVGVGGYREEPTTELWIAEDGAVPPMGTPTVDPSEVKPAKTVVPAKNSKSHAKAKQPAKKTKTKTKTKKKS